MSSVSCCGLVGASSSVYDKTYKEIVTETKLSDSSFIKHSFGTRNIKIYLYIIRYL